MQRRADQDHSAQRRHQIHRRRGDENQGNYKFPIPGTKPDRTIKVKDAGPCLATISIDPDAALERDGIIEGGDFPFTLKRISPSNNDPKVRLNWEVVDDTSRDFLLGTDEGRKSHDLGAYSIRFGSAQNVEHDARVQTRIDPGSGGGTVTVRLLEGDYYRGTKTTLTVPVKDDTGYAGRVLSVADLKVAEDHSYLVATAGVPSFVNGLRLPVELSGNIGTSATNPSVRVSFVSSGGGCKATASAQDLGLLGTGTTVTPRANYPAPVVLEWDKSRPASRERQLESLLMNDLYHEGDETLCVKFDQPKSLKLPGGASEYFATITLTDDDPAPTLTVDSPRAAEGAGMLDFTVTLTNPPQGKDVTLRYCDNRKGSAISGTDYTALTACTANTDGTLTFPKDKGDEPQKQVVRVTLTDDNVIEDDETVALRFRRAQNADFRNNARGVTARGVITDDDSNKPEVRLREAAPVTVQEGRTAVFHADIWVHKDGEWKIGSVNRDVVLRLVLGNSGSALASANRDDINNAAILNGRVILRSGESGIRLEVEAISDGVDEPVEAFRLEVTSGLDSFAKKSVATGIIYDGPTLRIAAPKGPATEGGRLKFPVTLGAPAATDISVAWKTESLAEHKAEAGKDYTAASGTLVFKAGETDKVIRVKTLQDNIDEPSETFEVVLTDPNVAGLDLGPLRARGIIRDDDKRPAVTIADASVTEGATLTLPITLNPAPAVPVKLEWRVRASGQYPATRGADYTGNATGTITVAAGEASAKVEFPTIDDNVDEATETFEVALVVLREEPLFFSSQRTAPDILAPLTATATILDNDTPRLSINDLVVEEGKSAVFTVRLSSPRTYPVEVEFKTEDGGGPQRTNLSNVLVSDDARGTGPARDYDGVTTPRTIRFAPGETRKRLAAIRVVDDDELESHSEYFQGVISLPSGADPTEAAIGKGTGLVKIRDIDTTRYWIANKDTTVREGRPVRIRVKRDRTEFATSGQFGCIEGTGSHEEPSGHAGTIDRTHPTPLDRIDVYTVEKNNAASACGQATDGPKLAHFSFAEGEDEASFWVRTVDDDRKEPDETFVVWIDGSPSGGNVDFPQGATVRDHLAARTVFTILDDDGIHRFRVVSANSPWEGEEAHFDIYVDSDAGLAALKAATNPYVLDFKVGADTDTAKQGVHYTPVSNNVEFDDLSSVASKSQPVARISIPTVQDEVLDGDKTLSVSLSEIFANVSEKLPFRPAHGGGAATATIRDDEAYHLSIDDAVGDEGDPAAVRIALSKPAEQDFTIRFRTRQGTAKVPGDFTACGPKDDTCAFMFPEGATEARFMVPTTEDTVPEETEEFRVVIEEVDYANLVIDDRVAVVKIRDDDARSVTITGLADADVPENEEWTSSTPAWEGAPDGGVAWTLEGDDAARFTIDPDTGVLTLPAQNFEAPADKDKDNVHEITVRVTDEDGNTATVALSVTVTDVVYGYLYLRAGDLAGGKVSVDAATGRVSAEEGIRLSVPFTYGNRTAQPGGTFRYGPRPAGAPGFLNFGFRSSLSGTAGASDIIRHDAAGGGIRWANSDQYGAVPTVTLIDDGLAEGAETFSVEFSPVNDDVPVRIWTGTKHIDSDTLQIEIVDNDEQGVTVDPIALPLAEADDATTQDKTENVGTYTVVLDSQPAAGTVTVAVESGDTTAATVSPASLTFTVSNWNKAQTVTVTAVDDDVDNTDDKRTVTVTHTVTGAGDGNDYGAVTADPVTVTVADDDARGVTVAPTRLTVRETDDAATAGRKENEAAYTVVLDSKPAAGTVTVAVASGDTKAATVSPASLTFTAGNWNAPQTVTVTGVDDKTDNPGDRRTLSVTHSVTAAGNDYSGVTADPVAVLVTDAGHAPALEIQPRTLHLQESDIASTAGKKENEGTYEVRLNFVPSADARVAISLTPATTRLGLDKNALTFTSTNWNDWQTVKVIAVDDNIRNDPLAEEVEIGHSVTGAGGTSVTAGSVTATVYDDDALNQLGFDAPSVAEGDSGEATLTFTLTLSRPAQESLSVLLNPFTAGTTATPTPVGATTPGPTHDFDRSDIDSRTVTFAVGDRTKTFGVTVYGDVRHEGDETVRVHVQSRKPSSLVLAPGLPREGTATGVANAIASGTITDDDAAPDGIVLSLAPRSESRTPDTTPEGRKGQRNFDVVATTRGDTVYGEDVTITLGIGADGDTATLDEDFEADFWKSGTVSRSVELVLPEGESSVSDSVEFRLRPTDDALDEANEDFSVTGVSGDIEVTPATHTITDDDDEPTVSVADAAAVTEGNDPETTTDMTFTVTLSNASGRTVTVPYTLSGTATEDEDYTAPDPLSLDIAPGDTSGTITIPVKGDTVDEANETVIVTLGAPTNATLSTTDGAGTGTGTITDDDVAALSIADATAAEGGTATFAVTLSIASLTDVTVTATTADGSAKAPGDYTAKIETLTIDAGDTSAEFEVAIASDTVPEFDETFTVTLSAATGATIDDGTATGTITGADALLSVSDATAREGGNLTFTITRTGDATGTASVKWTTGDDATDGAKKATAGADYTAVTTAETVNFAADETAKTVTVASLADSLVEGDETFAVTLASPTGAVLDDATGIGTVTEGTTGYSIADASATEGDALTFTVTRSGLTSVASSVEWTTADDTADGADKATAGADYTAQATAATLSFKADDTSAEITVASTQDTLDEPAETFRVVLSTPSGALIDGEATGTITDDDGAPSVSVADASAVTEGDDPAATTNMAFTVTLSAASGRSVVVPYTLTGTASAGADYTAPDPLSVTIAPGDTEATITVPVKGDRLDESDETVIVTLQTPENADIDSKAGVGTGRITDDDEAALSIAGGSAIEGLPVTFAVTLSTPSAEAVTVTVTTSDGTATAPDDYTAKTETLTIAAGDTKASFAVTTLADQLIEIDETFTATLSKASGASIADATATGTIVGVKEQFSVSDASAREGQDASFTITRSGDTTGPAFVLWTTGDDPTDGATKATPRDDYTRVGSAQRVNFAPGDATKTITVKTKADDLLDGDETFAVILGAHGGAALDDALGIGTITEGTTAYSVADASVAEGEDATVTISRRGYTAEASSVRWKTANDNTADAIRATADDDYTRQRSPLKVDFAADATSVEITIETIEDTFDEPDETFRVLLSKHNNTSVLTDDAAIVTITDDDDAPSVSVDDAKAVDEGDAGDTASLTFTVKLSTASGRAVTVPYTLGGTATGGVDYEVPKALSVAISPGDDSVDIAITVTGDAVDEANETITVTLGDPTNATISTVEGAGAASGTITDDDTRGVTVSKTKLTLAEADDTATKDTEENIATYTVVLDSKPAAGTVTIAVESGDKSAATISPASLAFTATNWNVAQTVTVTAVADEVDNTDDKRTATITHALTATGEGNDYGAVKVGGVEVTVTDDDTRGVTVTGSPLTLAEVDDTSTNGKKENEGSYTVVLTSRPTANVVINLSAGVNAPVTLDKARLTFAPDDWDTAQTVTVTAVDDAYDNPGDERTASITHTVVAGTSDYGGVIATPVSVTVTDDDDAPSRIILTVDADTGTQGTQTSVAEGGGAKTVRVTATITGTSRFPAAKTVVLTVGKATDSAVEGTDYTEVGAVSITIQADAASGSGTFTLTPADDKIDDDAESLTIEGSVTGETGVTVSPASIAIDDNDDAPTGITLSAAPSTVAENAATAAKITVTATVTGGTTYDEETTVTVTVGAADDTATSGEDYAAVTSFDIDIPAGAASAEGSFSLDPTDDAIAEESETLTVSGASGSLKVTDTEVTITDDEATPTATLALSPATINESGNGNVSTVTATLNRASSQDLTLTVSAGAGVTLGANKVLTIDAGETASEGTVTLTAEDNDVDAADLEVTVSATASGGNGVANPADRTLTVRDDDARGVTVAPKSLSVRETDDGTTTNKEEHKNTYTVVLDSEPAAGTVTIAIESADTKAATVSPANLIFNTTNWSTAQTVTVTGVDDDIDNIGDKRTASVTHAVSTTGNDYAALESADPVEVTITDDDGAPAVSVANASAVTEGDDPATTTAMTFTVTLSTESGKAVTVPYSLSGTATAGDDYTDPATKSVTIAAGDTTANIVIAVKGDELHEPNETIIVTLDAPTNASIGDAEGAGTGTGTITDDETLPVATLVLTPATISEKDGAITFTVTRSGATGAAATVKWNTAADTAQGAKQAIAGTDYTAVTTARTLSFAIGVTTQTFTVTTAEDSLHEGDETFLVKLTAPTGGATISDAEAIGTITDDDAKPTKITLTVDADTATDNVQDSITENGGAKTVRVTATLGGSSTFTTATTVTVKVGTSDDSATEATDYETVADQTITIPAGASSAHVDFTLTPKQDVLHEGDETIALEGTATDLDVTDTSITLTDDDAAPTLYVDSPSVAEGDSGSATLTFTVTLGAASGGTVTVAYADAGTGTATSATDYATVVAGTLTFAPGDTSKTVQVTVNGDTLEEANETVVLRLSSPSNATLSSGGATLDATGTITDDDTASDAIALTVSPTSVSEDAAATEVTVTATIGGTNTFGADTVIKVNVGAGTDSAIEGTDYAEVTDFDLTIKAGASSGIGTFTLTPTDNGIDADDKSINIGGTLTGATVTDATLALTDDDERGITVTPKTLTIAEADDDGTQDTTENQGKYEVVLDTEPTGTVTVKIASGDIEVVTVSPDSLTFTSSSWQDPQEVTVTAVADAVDNPNDKREVEIAHTVDADGTDYEDETADAVEVTVTDDDDAAPTTVTLTVDERSVGEGDGDTTVRVTATLGSGSRFVTAQTVAVTIGKADDTAISGTDYVAVEGFTITIPTGEASAAAEFTLTPTDDSLVEQAESLSVEGTSTDLTVTGTSIEITDNDAGGITLSANPAAVAEDAEAAITMTVTASVVGNTAFAEDVVVTVSVGGGDDTAISGTDYAAVNDFTITILAGEASATGSFDLAPVDDNVAELDEIVTVAGAAGDLPVTAASVTITDDDESVTPVTITDREDPVPSIITVHPDAPVPADTPSPVGAARALTSTAGGLSSGPSVTEGAPAMFMLMAARPDSATDSATDNDIDPKDLTVDLMVADAPPPSDFLASGAEGPMPVVIPDGQTTARFRVPTVDDGTDEPNGRVTVKTMPGVGYELGSPGTASVTVNDDDPTVVTLSLLDQTMTAGEADETATLRLTLNRGLVHPEGLEAERLEVPITVAGGVLGKGYDLTLADPPPPGVRLDGATVIFTGGVTASAAMVDIRLSAPEGAPGGTLVVSIPKSSMEGDPPMVATNLGGGAVGVMPDDRRIALKGIVPPPAAWLVRFGRTVAEQVLAGVADRVSALRDPGMQGSLAGQTLPFDRIASGATPADDKVADPDTVSGGDIAGSLVHPLDDPTDRFSARFRPTEPESRAMTAREVLLGSDFSLTGATDDTGGTLALWGRASQSDFDGQEGSLSLDGEVTTMMFGADYARDEWLAGLLLSRSTGDGSQSGPEAPACLAGQGTPANPCAGPLRDGNAEIKASLTSAVAYATLRPSERMELWGALGHGEGRLTVETAINGIQDADTAWTMAAAGFRSELVPEEGPTLALVSDALWMGISSDRTRFLEASGSDVTRLRLGLEGSWEIALEGDGSLTPRLETGLRHDGGDAETGFGVDLGGGLEWSAPMLGLSLDLSGRTLLAHDDGGFEDRGFSAGLTFDPDPASKRGLSLTPGHEYGGNTRGHNLELIGPFSCPDGGYALGL